MDTSDTIAAVAALISAIAAGAAWRSASASRRAEQLVRAEFAERSRATKGYLIDSARWTDEKGRELVSFSCSFSNTATVAVTVSGLHLLITAYSDDGVESVAILEATKAGDFSPWDLDPISAPMNIPACSTQAGWITFEIPAHFTASKRIDHFKIRASSPNEILAEIGTYIVKRVPYASRIA